jgi:hypothetical protein
MSSPDDARQSSPDGGRHPGGQPPGQPGHGRPGFGPPDHDPSQYAHPGYGQPKYHQTQYGQQHGEPGYGGPGYGGPGYGPPYGQAPYGAPGYGPPAGYPYGRPTNSLAILSLVLAFVFAPAGLVTGIMARRQIKRTHEDGDGLALAGIIVGGIATAFFVLLIVIWIIAAIALTNDGFAP